MGERAPWKFLSVRRTADVLYKSVQDNHLWAVDRGIDRVYFADVVEGVNSFISSLVAQRALIAGECYADADKNNSANIALGRVFFNLKYTPIFPAQSIFFQVILDTEPLNQIV